MTFMFCVAEKSTDISMLTSLSQVILYLKKQPSRKEYQHSPDAPSSQYRQLTRLLAGQLIEQLAAVSSYVWSCLKNLTGDLMGHQICCFTWRYGPRSLPVLTQYDIGASHPDRYVRGKMAAVYIYMFIMTMLGVFLNVKDDLRHEGAL